MDYAADLRGGGEGSPVNDLLFDESTHTYRLGGRALPSVTKILDLLDPYVETDNGVAAERGTLVHDCCQYHDEGIIDADGIDESILGYYSAYRRFHGHCAVNFVDVEVCVAHAKHGFAGRIDRISEDRGGLTLWDIKSGVYRRTHPIQRAAYKAAYEAQTGNRIKKTACLYLRPTGEFKLDWNECPSDYPTFLAALRCYNWRQA